MVHLGQGDLIDEDVVDRCVTLVESTSPNALLAASLDSARRAAAVDGQALLPESLRGLALTREAVREVPGLDVLDERLVGRGGSVRLRPAAADDRRARHAHERLRAGARCCASRTTCTWSWPART